MQESCGSGVAELERALELDHNLAEAHAQTGSAKLYMGRGAETVTHINEALRLSPRDIFSHRWFMIAGFAKLQINEDAEAVCWFRRSIEANRNDVSAHFGLAAALPCLARWTKRKLLQKRYLRLFQASPSAASGMELAAITQFTSPNVSVCIGACGWRRCRSDDVGFGSWSCKNAVA